MPCSVGAPGHKSPPPSSLSLSSSDCSSVVTTPLARIEKQGEDGRGNAINLPPKNRGQKTHRDEKWYCQKCNVNIQQRGGELQRSRTKLVVGQRKSLFVFRQSSSQSSIRRLISRDEPEKNSKSRAAFRMGVTGRNGRVINLSPVSSSSPSSLPPFAPGAIAFSRHEGRGRGGRKKVGG